MSNMITRCPKCATSFRITSAQLQSAKGAVRCGSCLHIFKAQDHLISSDAPVATAPAKPSTAKPASAPAPKVTSPITRTAQPAAPKTSATTATKAPAPSKSAPKASTPVKPAAATTKATAATSNTRKPDTDSLLFNQADIDKEIADLGDDDDLLISDDMDLPEKKAEGKYLDGFLDIEPTAKQSASLFERHHRIEKEDDTDDTDESWAMSLLDESDEDNKFAVVKQNTNTAEQTAQDEFEQHSDEYLDVSDDDSTPPYDTNSKAPAPTQHSHIFSLVSDPNESPDFKEIFTEEELSEEMHASRSEHAKADTYANNAGLRAHDTSRAALLMNIMPEPVIMTSRRKRSWYQRKLWLLLSLLMILVLLVQVAWLQFSHLSRIEPYRSGYEVVCPLLGCTLPVLIDRDLIRVRNLVVRKHPTTENALIVDVILINTAPFKQPFPDLLMAFSDINEKPLAARRFTAREYLGGELAGLDLIPQNQPVHISLELVDPGEAAVNYKIEPY